MRNFPIQEILTLKSLLSVSLLLVILAGCLLLILMTKELEWVEGVEILTDETDFNHLNWKHFR